MKTRSEIGREPVFETMNEPDRREKFLSAVFAVWAGAQR